ncbi:MAG TPA: EamA family transporter [Thermoanaerobaculia bacterium]|nr:EamA family transporter [Thermoanaerobaculia bacterium]
MSLAALALVLGAAVLHAAWNLAAQQVAERFALLAWAMAGGAVLASPLLAGAEALPGWAWAAAAASGVLNCCYFVALAAAYGRGDFSVVYPVARGAAPLFLTAGSIVLLGERPGPAGLAGLGLVVAGLVVMTSPSGRGSVVPAEPEPAAMAARVPRRAAGTGTALLVAALIAAYSLVDGAAVHFVPPAPYSALVFLFTASALLPLMVARLGWSAPLGVLRRHWRRIALVGGLSFIAYLLVLHAYAVSPVAYAGAVRESSVVVAALAGWLLLGEPLGLRRTAGSLLLLAGVLTLAAAGPVRGKG